jgi:hypothetical protein
LGESFFERDGRGGCLASGFEGEKLFMNEVVFKNGVLSFFKSSPWLGFEGVSFSHQQNAIIFTYNT